MLKVIREQTENLKLTIECGVLEGLDQASIRRYVTTIIEGYESRMYWERLDAVLEDRETRAPPIPMRRKPTLRVVQGGKEE